MNFMKKNYQHEFKVNQELLKSDFDFSLLQGLEYSYDHFKSHKEIYRKLKNKNPYTITVLIDHLKPEYWNRKEYVKKTKIECIPKFTQLLYEYLGKEYDGRNAANQIYGEWLDKYRPILKKQNSKKDIDEYIQEVELVPRYKEEIFKRFKNHQKLLSPYCRTNRERYYNLPEPLNRVDWRNSFDNIFIWFDGDRKLISRGGSGGSGSREINSKFIYGLALINKEKPVPSYLFLYSRDNELKFIQAFDELCVPNFDVGSNYHLDWDDRKQIIKGNLLLNHFKDKNWFINYVKVWRSKNGELY